MRGQKSRKGEGKGVRIGFEGGQTPLYRRLPKYPGRTQNYHRSEKYSLLKVSHLNQFKDGETVDFDKLFLVGLLGKNGKRKTVYKVVCDNGALTKRNLVVHAHSFTTKAIEEIERNGGKCVIMSKTAKGLTEAAAEQRRQEIASSNLERLKQLRLLKSRRANSI